MDARIWTCQTNLVDLQDKPLGPASEPVTVGQRLALVCQGPPVEFARETLRLSLPEQQKFDLKLLKVASLKEDGAELIVTTYRVVETNRFEKLVLTDGMQEVNLQGIELQVQSVIDPKTNPEGKPYAPLGPMKQSYPMFLWVGGALVIFIALSLFWRAGLRARQRRQWRQELERHGSALTPYHQFNKEIRNLQKQFIPDQAMASSSHSQAELLAGLKKAYLWFLASELQLPAHRWSRRLTLSEIRNRHRSVYRVCKPDLLLSLRELDRASHDPSKVSIDEVMKLTEICRRSIEQIRRARLQTRTSDNERGA